MKRILVIIIFLLAVSFQAVRGADLLDIGTSARSLGLGRSFVGITNAGECVFANPAGLYSLKKLEIISMYTELSGDVKYTLIGVAAPMPRGTLGFGYASNKVSDVFATTLDAATGRPVVLEPFNYGTDIFMVDYADSINKNLTYGLRFKIIDKGGQIASAGKGRGVNLDLGLSYTISDDAKAGLVMENMITGGPGALIWNNGLQEKMPFVVNIGGSYRLKRFNTTVYSDISFRNIDPYELRVGAEWNAWKTLELRAGFEQRNLSLNEKYLNYSLGVGYRFDGLRVDYAYYADTLLPYNSRHYVSFAIALPGARTKVTAEAKVCPIPNDGTVNLGYLGDKSVFDMDLYMTSQRWKYITRGEFVKVMESEFLKEKFKRRERKAFSFVDVPLNYPPAPYIALAKKNGHVRGYPDGTFKPKKIMNRAEFIKIVESMFAKGDPEMEKKHPNQFLDVYTGHWAQRYVTFAKESGHILGYPDNLFKPRKWVSKAEVMTILKRMNMEGAALRVKEAPSAKIKAKQVKKKVKPAFRKGLYRSSKINRQETFKAKQVRKTVKPPVKQEDRLSPWSFEPENAGKEKSRRTLKQSVKEKPRNVKVR